MRNVKLAENAGFCFGVQRAVEEALKIQKQYNKKIYTLGPLIHNNDVVKYLEENNIYAISLEQANDLGSTDVIVIRSHGVSKAVLDELENKGLVVINATCPFVTNIQKKVKKYSEQGYNIVILGDEVHPEVVGINGWCEDKAIITKDGTFDDNLPAKICAVSQTTEKEENWQNTINNLSSKSKELLAFNTICSATAVRQQSVEELSKTVDAMIVVGGKNSSNTTKLYQIAKEHCDYTIHIENISELPQEYINNEGFENIGVTAGASTPDWIIREVINVMQDEVNKNEDQLALMNQFDKELRIGDEVNGEILSIAREEVMISLVGYMIDGVIPFRELTSLMEPSVMAEELNVGDAIKAKVVKLKNNDGYVVLSRLEYEKKIAYEELEQFFNEGTTFKITITEVKDKGLVAYYKGVRVFIPASQIDTKFVNDKEKYKGQTLEVKLIDFLLGNPVKVVASRRILIETEQARVEAIAWDSFNEGDIVKGEIKRFTNFGAFAEVSGVDGLIHLSQISWTHVKKADDVLKKGQILDLKIIEMNRELKKLSLSVKALTPEPWKNAAERYPEGTVVLGRVVRLNDFGAFVELEPGLDGLVHISKLSHDRVEHPSEVLTIGDDVKAIILSVDEEKKRISLSIKDL